MRLPISPWLATSSTRASRLHCSAAIAAQIAALTTARANGEQAVQAVELAVAFGQQRLLAGQLARGLARQAARGLLAVGIPARPVGHHGQEQLVRIALAAAASQQRLHALLPAAVPPRQVAAPLPFPGRLQLHSLGQALALPLLLE